MSRTLSEIYSVKTTDLFFLMTKSLVLTISFVIFTWPSPQCVSAEEPWVLSNDQRRAFLHYYSPIILKQADEDKHGGKRRGHDWITNFDFDQDGNFANNEKNWKKEKHKFIDQEAHQDWQIRPTLYTAAIEFMINGRKSLILLYHVYHAMQECRHKKCKEKTIHDWERIEIRLDGIHPNGPDQGETFRYYVLTAHSKHAGRRGGHEDLRFVDKYETPHTKPIGGKHLLVWQAKWRDRIPGGRKGELRFVKDPLEDFYDKKAKVDVSGPHLQKQPFHYIFVNQEANGAKDFFGAQSLTQERARTLASGKDDDRVVRTKKTKRITYELQDLADVFPTHWIHANGPDTNVNWAGDTTRIALEEELTSTITGTSLTIPAGIQEFSRNPLKTDGLGKRKGYPHKHWFWGTYVWGQRGISDLGKKKTLTEKAYETRDKLWDQHDYFAQTGDKLNDPPEWLPEGWHLAENGGFDGRWTPLFLD